MHLESCALAPSMYMQQPKKTKPTDKQKEDKEAKKESTQWGKQRKSTQRGQTSMLSSKGGFPRKANVGLIEVHSYIILEYGQHMCAIKQSYQRGLEISCTKDGCEPARDYV